MSDKRDKVYINPDGSTSKRHWGDGNGDWWKADPNGVHKDLIAMFRDLESGDQDRIKMNVRALRLYGNLDIGGFFPQQYTSVLQPVSMPESRMKYNIISSTVDTVTSKIGKMKPRITYLTSGGTWDDQMRARKLTKWTDGMFYMNKVYEKHRMMFRDGCVFDAGVLKHYIKGDKIVSERVLSSELFVDKVDGMYGEPQHLYHVKFMRRDVLAEMFPEKEKEIYAAADRLTGELRADDRFDHHVQVVEGWKLPSGKDAGDGRHVMSIDGLDLLDEEYDKNYFPFTFFNWSKPMVGFWGQSLADRLMGNQLEINKMLQVIQKSFHLGSAFKVFLEYGSKVARDHINNEIGSIIYYAGAKPEFYVPQTVHPEFFSFLEWLIRSSYEEAGISQLSAASKKPAELESGRALREFNNIETERFAAVAQTFEESFERTAEIYIDLASDLYNEDGVDLEITTGSKKFLETIKWSEIDIKEQDFIMKRYPTSLLPTEPAGRIATVQEWVNSGIIPPDEGLRLLDFPDIEEYRSFKDSPIDMAYFLVDYMTHRGKYIPPEPFMDLRRSVVTMQEAYLKGMINGMPENRLDLLRRWMKQAKTMMDQAAQGMADQQAAAQAAAAGGQAAQGNLEQAVDQVQQQSATQQLVG